MIADEGRLAGSRSESLVVQSTLLAPPQHACHWLHWTPFPSQSLPSLSLSRLSIQSLTTCTHPMSSAATATAGPVPQLLAVNPFQLQQLQLQHHGLQQAGQNQSTRPVIERGASWSYNETRILLSLWGQDMVQRQLTNSKRTRHVWEKIAERIREHGFERTAGQSPLLPACL